MNRAVATVLALICLPMGFSADLAPPSWAQVAETPEEKQQRIERFQEYRLIFEEDPDGGYVLRQGPEFIYDQDFVELMNDPSLTRDWLQQRNRDYAVWLAAGLVAVPVGSVLFYQNFLGQGPTAIFAEPVPPDAAPTNPVARANVSDWRTFTLSVAGVGLAAYGIYNLSLWLLEELDQRHPDRLEPVSIRPRVREFNEELRERLNLEPGDIPSPPTPRPSVSPSPSPFPSGFTPPSPPVGGPDALPMDHPPSPIPFPLPVLQPGELPSPLLPAPEPSRPFDFDFPGQPPAEDPPVTPELLEELPATAEQP